LIAVDLIFILPENIIPNESWRQIVKFNVTIDRDEDGVWIVECPSIPGCVSQGTTKEIALENIKDAIALCLEVRAEKGFPLTIETRQVEVAA
jgi:predicted RNase H-like HicB family nuclease